MRYVTCVTYLKCSLWPELKNWFRLVGLELELRYSLEVVVL